MTWIIITSDAGKKIVPLQKHMFKKYAADVKPKNIDLGSEPIKNWCLNINNAIVDMNIGKYVMMMLDDHILIDRITRIISMPYDLDRLELGTMNGHHKNLKNGHRLYYTYNEDTPYSVSTQPSMWRKDTLLKVLKSVDSNPWFFETKGKCVAGIVKKPVIRVIQESAISRRAEGKVNLCGMKLEDINEAISLGLVKESEIIYGFNGTGERTKESYGKKYEMFY